jgi:hypothetical protein
MSATDAFENKLLTLYFKNTAAANVGDASGLQPSGTAGSIHVSLHTADPGDSATLQTASESAYTNYARQAVARGAGWTISGTTQSANAGAVTFPQCGVTGSTISHTGLGYALSAGGSLDMIGTSALVISQNITPSFAIGALVVTLD